MEVTQPTAKHTHTVVNLHGRGSNAREYQAEFEESEASDGRTLRDCFPGVKWVYPTAPQIHSARFGEEMSQWFDMWRTEHPYERSDDQLQDLASCAGAIQQLVLAEGQDIGLQNVILCGISQGAAIAVTVLLKLEQRIGGFIGFAAWLPPYAESVRLADQARSTPVFLGHCEDDETIGIAYGKKLKEHLEALGMGVKWKGYDDGGHWVNEPRGVDDAVTFLTKNMSLS